MKPFINLAPKAENELKITLFEMEGVEKDDQKPIILAFCAGLIAFPLALLVIPRVIKAIFK